MLAGRRCCTGASMVAPRLWLVVGVQLTSHGLENEGGSAREVSRGCQLLCEKAGRGPGAPFIPVPTSCTQGESEPCLPGCPPSIDPPCVR